MIGSELFRFLLVGVANSAIGYGVVMFFFYVLGAPAMLANVCGYLVGGTVSYVLNRNFTFNGQRTHTKAVPLFAVCVAACFALNAAVLTFSTCIVHLSFPLAQAVAMIAYTGAFYVLNRFVVFPRSSTAAGET